MKFTVPVYFSINFASSCRVRVPTSERMNCMKRIVWNRKWRHIHDNRCFWNPDGAHQLSFEMHLRIRLIFKHNYILFWANVFTEIRVNYLLEKVFIDHIEKFGIKCRFDRINIWSPSWLANWFGRLLTLFKMSNLSCGELGFSPFRMHLKILCYSYPNRR